MTPQEFESWMNGFQSLVTAAAIFGTGVWALFKFTVLGQVSRSRAELRKLELEQSKATAELRKLEQEAKIGDVIEIAIKATQRSLPNDSFRYISAVVEVENKGSHNARLEYLDDRKPFAIFAASFREDSSLEFKQVAAYSVPLARAPQATSPSLIVHPGGLEKIPFFFRLDGPGLYLFTFSARASDEEQMLAKELGFRFPGNWVAKEYFVVE